MPAIDYYYKHNTQTGEKTVLTFPPDANGKRKPMPRPFQGYPASGFAKFGREMVRFTYNSALANAKYIDETGNLVPANYLECQIKGRTYTNGQELQARASEAFEGKRNLMNDQGVPVDPAHITIIVEAHDFEAEHAAKSNSKVTAENAAVDTKTPAEASLAARINAAQTATAGNDTPAAAAPAAAAPQSLLHLLVNSGAAAAASPAATKIAAPETPSKPTAP